MSDEHRIDARLSLTQMSSWSPALREAVHAIPEDTRCSRELYVDLLERNMSDGGRAAVVTRAGQPMAVIGLRPDGRGRWKSFSNWLIPGFVCVAEEADVLPAFARLRAEVFIAWWRMPRVPANPAIRELIETPVHRLRVDEREMFWRTGSMWRTIRRARTKCDGFQITIDEPGAAEWTIRSAAQKWGHPARSHTVEDDLKITTARALEKLGRHKTIILRDGERRVAGQTCLIDDDTLIMTGLYRDESIGSLPTGVVVMHEAFELAARLGLSEVDLGGGYAYKAQWAPESGSRYDVIVAPQSIYRARRLAARLTRRR